ncbi:unnamed protein product [Pelagomonas calceolata]|uniref:non-specific serine/threonine protein kinase n=1 Tax=Pelagomonas calceolata TaxID=35677 RepID=A0A8J2SSP5_9STRA|nr:unnamed protein product [Pelagomonas calceolata]|mmetsp:Transcript_4689/g.11162  ORF Transcript_4689/g.11162 Transcript_4689/m.11162 type:complete len:324 (-) Transcript_4689:1173-2144(-)
MGCGGSKAGGSGERADANSEFARKYNLDDKELGTGAFSRVILATSNEGTKVAVKCISKNGELKQEDIDSLHEEVAVLRSVDHPNIVKLYDFFDEKRYYYMAIELMEGGELFERIVKKTFYNEMDARGLVRILLDALAYLHHRGIVHRDLKPENLLLKSPFNDFDIKLADFGFAKKVEGKSLDTQCGTPGYVAPEILKGKKYGTAVDMWSCGVIVYILLGGYPPRGAASELFRGDDDATAPAPSRRGTGTEASRRFVADSPRVCRSITSSTRRQLDDVGRGGRRAAARAGSTTTTTPSCTARSRPRTTPSTPSTGTRSRTTPRI